MELTASRGGPEFAWEKGTGAKEEQQRGKVVGQLATYSSDYHVGTQAP